MTDFLISNNTDEINSQCKIVVYNWRHQDTNLVDDDNKLSESIPIDISSRIIRYSYSKALGNPSGTFEIVLGNNTGSEAHNDWKDIIKRGTWCVVYMSQKGDLEMNSDVAYASPSNPEKVRCIGYIERISTKTNVGDNGEIDVNYVVSGRDFGVIYEETTVWHNTIKYDKALLEVATSSLDVIGRTPLDSVMKTIHNLFFSPKDVEGVTNIKNDSDSLTSISRQWMLPRKMVEDLELATKSKGASFWGDLRDNLNFSFSEMGISISNPVSYLTGQAWSKLKQISIGAFHELFTEIDELGTPQLIFRPIPWAIKKDKYGVIAESVEYYKDVDFVKVPAVSLISADLGEDDQNRYNSFFATVVNELNSIETNTPAFNGSDFPFNDLNNIKRHGFRAMHVSVNSLINNSMRQDGLSDHKLLIAFNELLKDYWENAIHAESGRISKIGSNDLKIGKCLEFESDVPYFSSKRYYIEGYSDNFEVIENGASVWTQDVLLTRGFEKKDLQNGKGFSERDEKFKHSGEFTKK